MPEEQIGWLSNSFPSQRGCHRSDERIRQSRGYLKYKGHTTEFTDVVASLQVDNKPIEEAKVGNLVGIKVKERVREGDKVYKVVE